MQDAGKIIVNGYSVFLLTANVLKSFDLTIFKSSTRTAGLQTTCSEMKKMTAVLNIRLSNDFPHCQNLTWAT